MEQLNPFKKIKVSKLNQGAYFKLEPTENAPLWIRGEYLLECKKYSCYKHDDVNHETLMRGTREVYIER